MSHTLTETGNEKPADGLSVSNAGLDDVQDAKRYRWLRECSQCRSDRVISVQMNHYISGKYIKTTNPSREVLDAVIDAELAPNVEAGANLTVWLGC